MRTGTISFHGSQCHVDFERFARLIIQQDGPRPYVRVQARTEALLLDGAEDWMRACLGRTLALIAGPEAAHGWSPNGNSERELRWKVFRLDLAADFQGLHFDWTDVERVVARQGRRGISKAPTDEDFEAEAVRMFKMHERDHLLDAAGRGAQLETLQVGSLKSRTSMSLHRKDLAVRARYGLSAEHSLYASLLWEPSGGFDPSAQIWRAEMRFDAAGLHLAERGDGPDEAPDDRVGGLSPYELGALVSREGIAILWEFATRQIKLRAPGTTRAREGLDARWVAIQAAAGAPPYTVEQARSKQARARSLEEQLAAFIEGHNRSAELAAALMNRIEEISDPKAADELRAELVAYCRANGIGTQPSVDRARRASARVAYLGADARDGLHRGVDPVGFHVQLMCVVAEATAEDWDEPGAEWPIPEPSVVALGGRLGFFSAPPRHRVHSFAPMNRRS